MFLLRNIVNVNKLFILGGSVRQAHDAFKDRGKEENLPMLQVQQDERCRFGAIV